jgi:four helix bundle protein
MSVANNLKNENKILQSNNYDLTERTTKFGQDILIFCKKLVKDEISKPIISQIVRSGTSIGANYREANCAISKKDFVLKISLCRKEANETEHWLTMFSTIFPEKKTDLRNLWQENHQLSLIFSKIYTSSKNNLKNTI